MKERFNNLTLAPIASEAIRAKFLKPKWGSCLPSDGRTEMFRTIKKKLQVSAGRTIPAGADEKDL